MKENSEVEELDIIANIIDEMSGMCICRLTNCDFPLPGDKIIARNADSISEFLITKRTMVIDAVDGYMCWNMYATQIGIPTPLQPKTVIVPKPKKNKEKNNDNNIAN